MNEREVVLIAERVLLEHLWAMPGVRADLSAAARAAFERGAESVPEDIRAAARLGIVRRQPFGARTLTDGQAHAFLLDVIGLNTFSQVVAIDSNGLLKHATVGALGAEYAPNPVWDISRSITERLEWLGFLPRIGVQSGGHRHVVEFAVDPDVWETMPTKHRENMISAIAALARDREEIIAAHRGPILVRLSLAPIRNSLRSHSGQRPVYEAELLPD
jgi:hypothetical protein